MLTLRSLALASAALLCGMIAAPARAADAPVAKPLRTLVYHTSYTAQVRNEEQTSGFLPGRGAGAITMGSAQVDRRTGLDDNGTLTIDVIAATGDGGLVVDAAYSGTNSQQPAIRIAILRDGRLTFDPRQPISVEALHILPFLARGLIAERDVGPGAAWTMPHAGPGSGTTSYSVTQLEGAAATLAVDSAYSVAGTQGYSENDRSVVVYQTDRLCPTSIDVRIHERHMPVPEQYAATDARLTASLTRDTFANSGR